MENIVPTLQMMLQFPGDENKTKHVTSILQGINVTNIELIEFLATNGTPHNGTTASSPSNSQPLCQFPQIFRKYSEVYHGYMSLFVCLFGTLANILNIVVLTRKEMNGSPINRILTGIAIADMLLMLEYIPATVHLYLWTTELGRDREDHFSWSWSAFLWFHANFSIVIHNVSVWLTLSLAVWRFIMIQFHTLAPVYCTMTRCNILILCAFVFPISLTIPNCFAMTIKEHGEESGIYMLGWSQLAEKDGVPQLLYYINIWLYTFILKLIPCIVLTIITGFLIRALYKAEERSARLKNNGNINRRASAIPQNDHHHRQASFNCNGNHRQQQSPLQPHVLNEQNLLLKKRRRGRNTDRTTRLLIAILILFLLTEFPQGILGLLSAIRGVEFFQKCYTPMGELMDIMALTNSAINFILYCLMSKQFRKTFIETFHLQWCKKFNCLRNLTFKKRVFTGMNNPSEVRRKSNLEVISRGNRNLLVVKDQEEEQMLSIVPTESRSAGVGKAVPSNEVDIKTADEVQVVMENKV